MSGRFPRRPSAGPDGGRFPADGRDDHTLSPDGVFSNGIAAATVAQFVLDHDEAAPIEAVAAHFGLTTHDVSTALLYYGRHLERLRSSGEVVSDR